jgi:putative cell wall-binding protein
MGGMGAPAQAADDGLYESVDPIYQSQAVNDVYDITFPVIGRTVFSDTFNACRSGCSRTHGATDIMAYGTKGLPIVAAHAGTIRWMANEQGGDCCAIYGLVHEDGWETWYIHMNNDTPFTDDGRAVGIAPGLAPGVHVEEGQLLGWVGDSGNAENTGPHLHFEIRDATGARVNPYYSLLEAKRNLLPRIAGADRYATAVEISKAAFPAGASVAYLATGMEFADALAGGPAAALAGGPVLLSHPGSLPPVTRDELARLDPDKIVILGGGGAVAAAVEVTLADYASAVERLSGADRYATAAAVSAYHYSPGVPTVFVANGHSFADALAGAPAAALAGAPLLLLARDSIPRATADELTRLAAAEIIVLGGEGVISAAVESELATYAGSGSVIRLAGSDRYETAAAILAYAFPAADSVYAATGLGFADALAGVPLAAQMGVPIVLVEYPVPAAIEGQLERLGAGEATILGGEGAVSVETETDLWTIFNSDYPTW